MANKITRHDIIERVAIADLDGFKGVLSSERQKQIFGRNIFGKKAIHISIDVFGEGKVTGSFKVCFGTDFQTFEFSFDQIADLANNPDKRVIF